MNIEFLLFLQRYRSDVLNEIFTLITFLGEEKIYIYILMAVYLGISSSLGWKLGTYLNCAGLISSVTKIICKIPRPWVLDKKIIPVEEALEGASGFSFPSGHSSQGTSIYAGIMINCKKHLVKIMALTIWIGVCFSRMYLGVHTPLDVIVSVLIVFFVIFLERRKIRFSCRQLSVIAICLLGFAIYCAIKGSTSAAHIMVISYRDVFRKALVLFTFILCWIINSRYVKYAVPKNIIMRIIIILFGGILVYLFREYVMLGVSSWLKAGFGSVLGKILAKGISSSGVMVIIYWLVPSIVMEVKSVQNNKGY